MRRICCIPGPSMALAALSVILPGLLVSGSAGAQGVDLTPYPRVEMDSLDERHKDWLTEHVGYIITENELDVFMRLRSAEQRDKYVEEFWKRRDPTPGTPRNEYYDEHYKRLAYANKFYGRSSVREGWQTDRGRTHIVLGPPQQVNRVHNGMVTYPLEVWMYAADPDLGLPPFFYQVFYQPYATGDFRTYSPLSDGPEKLLNPAGHMQVQEMVNNNANRRQLTPGYAPTGSYGENINQIYYTLREVDIEVASAAISLFPDDTALELGVTPLRSEMLLGDIQRVNERIMPDTSWAYRFLTGATESDVRFETLEIKAIAIPLIDIDGRPFVHFGTESLGRELHLGEYEENYYFSFDAIGSITTQDNKVLYSFDQTLNGELDEEGAQRFRSTQFLYVDVVPTVPGPQQFLIVLENTVAHSFGQAEFEFDVPGVFPDRVRLLGPLLCAAQQQAEDYSPFEERYPFQYGDRLLIPSVSRQYPQGADIQVFSQILLPRGYDGAVPLRVELRNAAGVVVHQADGEISPEVADEHGVVAPLLSLPTVGLAPGNYRVEVSLGGVEDGFATASLEIIEPPQEPIRPFINAQPVPPPTDIGIALERAGQYRAIGQIDKALELLRDAIARDPNNNDVQVQYVDMLDAAGEHRELIEVLGPRVARERGNIDGMMLLAKAHANLGEHYDAIRYYELIRLVGKVETPEILNALASQYDAQGEPDKAMAVLRRSLELDPEQPGMRAMLERLSVSTTDAVGEQ